jgi:hypothetical protein
MRRVRKSAAFGGALNLWAIGERFVAPLQWIERYVRRWRAKSAPRHSPGRDVLARGVVVSLGSALLLAACANGGSSPAPPPPSPVATTRSWAMGFGTTPPRPTVAAVIKGIDQWSRRAEYAAIHEEVPWRDLLTGMTPDAILDRDKVQLVAYLRGKGLKLYFMADLTDGLAREQEAPQLRSLGRSLTEPEVQQAYRAYVLAVSRKLQPEVIGLAAETNLVRAAAPPSLYAAVVRTANGAAADLRAAGSSATLLASVQVETAWGVLGGGGSSGGGTGYVGIERDLVDFPFAELLGLSSYPYFAFEQPEDVPLDYYRRLLAGRTQPVMVVEGGWSSASVGSVRSSPLVQARYVARHAQLLDAVAARGVIQLVYADIDTSSFPPPLPANLPLFTHIGLVGSDFDAKPALAEWDKLSARPLR